ncbi:MAG: hypothetical protein ABIA08_00370 [bacterium]
MFNIKNIKTSKIKTFLKKLPRNLVENYFFTFLGFSFLSVLLGLIIFYQSTIMIEGESNIEKEEILKFDQTTYQKVLDEWEIRSQNSSKIEEKEHSDPF